MENETYIREMIEARRAIHRRPEEGWTEFETTWRVVRTLRARGIKVLTGLDVIAPGAVMGRCPDRVERARVRALEAGVPQSFLDEIGGWTGAVAVIDTGRPGPVTAFRFDLDCVCVTESEDPAHAPRAGGFASEIPGLMHACGHDAHTAMGLALAHWLADNIEAFRGVFKLVFQPAEEGVRGAGAVAASGVLDDVSNIVAGHVGGRGTLGTIVLSEDGHLASTKLDVHFRGRPSHAGSDPEKGRSALMAACAAAMMMQGIPRSGEGASRIAVGKLNAGEGRNVTPVHADMELEVRGENAAVNDYMEANVRRIVEGVSAAYEVEAEIEVAGRATTMPVCPRLIGVIEAAAHETPGVREVRRSTGKSGSEDFTLMAARVIARGGEAAFFLYGCRHNGHHRADFDIQDTESMPIGFGVFTSVARRLNAR